MKYIVALDLGTSKVTGMIVRKGDDEFTVLALEKEYISSFIKKGSVRNVGDLAPVINRILKRLENRIGGKKILQVYVNLNGQSLRAEEHIITYSMKNEETVTQTLLDKLKLDALKAHVESGEVLDVVEPEYFINNSRESSPVGIPCSQIECHYKLIVGKTSFKKNIEWCFDQISTIKIAGYIISPLATAAAVLSAEDKELGCALIEFGAGVTTLSVYKNNLLRYLVTIPFGGENITKDICHLNVLENYAEKLKLEIGHCFSKNDEKGKKITLKSSEISGDVPDVEIKKLNECIFSRENEIIVNVLNQLKLSGYKDQLAAGLFIAGGASEMKGLSELIESQISLPVKQADILIPIDFNQDTLKKHIGYEQVLGMLWLANKNCVKFEEELNNNHINTEKEPLNGDIKENPKPKKNNIFKKIGRIGDLFGDDNSNDLE